MDKTENYIKMHLALPPCMQKTPCEGDYYYDRDTGKAGGRMGVVYFDTSNLIKLYEQDQLQEMLRDIEKFDTSIQNITILCNFARFCGIDNEDAEGRSNIHIRKGSMEQLWICFVMKELHNKTWDGTAWNLITV